MGGRDGTALVSRQESAGRGGKTAFELARRQTRAPAGAIGGPEAERARFWTLGVRAVEHGGSWGSWGRELLLRAMVGDEGADVARPFQPAANLRLRLAVGGGLGLETELGKCI